jgi:beta-glucosidase/6-phospho-beta-glucosidase/beta-galactosidase
MTSLTDHLATSRTTPASSRSAHNAPHNGAFDTSPAPADTSVDALPIKEFIWGAGVECSFIPHLDVDQFQWTQHDRNWKEDLRRAREELGIQHLRYTLPWHVLEPRRGQFEWSYGDERVAECDKLGINLMLDVMHFGTPLWLKQAVGDPEFPEALEGFAEAIVSRYSGSVKTWCPFNEPLVSALFSGDFGFWPPHQRKWRGYMPVLSRIVQGVSRGIRAIRRVMPEATVLLCDAAENYKTRVESLKTEVKRRNMRRFLVMDLLLGRVDQYHPLFSWVNSYGLSDLDLDWFKNNPQSPDILGLDYYPHSDWQLDMPGCHVRQRRADNPVGLYGVAQAYYQRYGIPMMLTETSIEGQPINREIWLENNIDDIKRLREEGVPMLGLIWWPLLDQVDWDGALTHRVGKIHEVGLYNLKRTPDGTLTRHATPLVKLFKNAVAGGEERIGKLEKIVRPAVEVTDEQMPPIGEWMQPMISFTSDLAPQAEKVTTHPNGNGNGHSVKARLADPAPGIATQPAVKKATDTPAELVVDDGKSTGRYGIVVFSHLRWGFVWQRPQQFLSRFAKKHSVLFVEEPFFDLAEGSEPRLDFHRVMPNVTVACPHCAPSMNKSNELPGKLREWAKEAIESMNEGGEFDRPLLWYYSPMDSAWSLGYFQNRGVVYDCMDELSQFTGAPKQLVQNEARLMDAADIVFTGGYELWLKKKQQHENVHFFGCGVDFDHFNKASDPDTIMPPDIDFMPRPILGWFGVVDERVDYAMVGEMARMRPDWSFAMVGPVVKVDPNLLPHSPNLFWMGNRDYQVLPNYCRAFDVNMMCFAMNAATQYINPTKGLEYMATGKPIVSTPVRDVVRQWSDIVAVASNATEFVAAADRALRNPDPEQLQRGLERAKSSSWENTVKTMQELIKKAITKDDRRSKKKIEPLAEAELAYQFQHTQGS